MVMTFFIPAHVLRTEFGTPFPPQNWPGWFRRALYFLAREPTFLPGDSRWEADLTKGIGFLAITAASLYLISISVAFVTQGAALLSGWIAVGFAAVASEVVTDLVRLVLYEDRVSSRQGGAFVLFVAWSYCSVTMVGFWGWRIRHFVKELAHMEVPADPARRTGVTFDETWARQERGLRAAGIADPTVRRMLWVGSFTATAVFVVAGQWRLSVPRNWVGHDDDPIDRAAATPEPRLDPDWFPLPVMRLSPFPDETWTIWAYENSEALMFLPVFVALCRVVLRTVRRSGHLAAIFVMVCGASVVASTVAGALHALLVAAVPPAPEGGVVLANPSPSYRLFEETGDAGQAGLVIGCLVAGAMMVTYRNGPPRETAVE
ncbi:hypothetical protein DFJ69_2121 [Thermomonospora umbrina]|uniref:Uncharacterized protein n=2 Tax=Thermomonospora umbrina TaxID=111806 RepID=A0A3D9SLS4_9ACTN|nr:hypothetical protein DFJ69_2121 [Thermomonospora umbrina]